MRLFTYIIVSILFFLSACDSKKEINNSYSLQPSNHFLSFSIPEDTELPYNSIHVFTIENKEYLAYDGSDRKSIYVYDLLSGKLLKHIKYQLEGDESISKIGEFLIQDFNNIYISSPFQEILYKTDSAGHVIQRIPYSKTTDPNPIELSAKGSNDGPIVISGNQIYLTQGLNHSWGNEVINKSKIEIIIDTLNHTIQQVPLGFPPLISYKDIGSGDGAGFGCSYQRCFDGEHFVYSFIYSDLMYKASKDFKTIQKKKVKSQYATKVGILRIKTSSFSKFLKEEAESPVYGDCVYDPYRKVYYRFAYPSTELEENDSYLEILRNGRKQPSIMILNEDLEVLGETLLPEFTYASRAYFVREDGLYLSVSHFKRDDYSEDTLRFQRLELIQN